jgi:hypothetical protein
MRAALKNRTTARFAKAVPFAGVALFAAALYAQAACADEVSHPARTHRPTSLAQFCVGPGAAIASSPECEAAFAAALKASEDSTAQVVVTADGVVGPRGAEPLHFQKRAPWVRRLETLGKEGIPFVRVPQGPGSELVIGINRKGVLGFQLKQVANR